jgi:hypothetical protein
MAASAMNRRDQELLAKQFQWLRQSPRNDGVMIMAIAGIFVGGVVLGSTVFGSQIARGDSAPANTSAVANLSQPFAALPSISSYLSREQVALHSFQ